MAFDVDARVLARVVGEVVMKFWVYRWHSFNLCPHLSLASVVADEEGYPPVGRWFQFTWFGIIFNVQWPAKRSYRAWSWPPL